MSDPDIDRRVRSRDTCKLAHNINEGSIPCMLDHELIDRAAALRELKATESEAEKNLDSISLKA